MNQLHSNYLTMVRTVLAGLDTETAVWKNILPMQEIVSQIREVYTKATQEAQAKDGANPTGYTAEKDARLTQLADDTLKLAKKLSAYARINKVNALIPLVSHSYTSLTKGSEMELILRCQTIVSEADKRIKELKPYLVTPEDIGELQRTIEICKTLPGERNLIKGRRNLAVHNLRVHIQTLRELMNTLDDMVAGMITSDNFRLTYKRWRKVTYPSKTRTVASQPDTKVVS